MNGRDAGVAGESVSQGGARSATGTPGGAGGLPAPLVTTVFANGLSW